jgi:hypothetical protein
MYGDVSNLLFITDFNLSDIDWTTWVSVNEFEVSFLNILHDNYLLHHLDKPTKMRGHDIPHCLDLVISV